ncbi:MAG: hypothetical protein RLZZ436_3657, partial [Planctomycetota bacterium]
MLAAAFAALIAAVPGSAEPPGQRPNIIFIL